jgi:hypothetical protein
MVVTARARAVCIFRLQKKSTISKSPCTKYAPALSKAVKRQEKELNVKNEFVESWIKIYELFDIGVKRPTEFCETGPFNILRHFSKYGCSEAKYNFRNFKQAASASKLAG